MDKSTVFLAQSDTTVGFLSQSSKRLNEIKKRPLDKKFITLYNSFNSLNKRTPLKYRNLIRRSKKTTFILKNKAFRVAPSAFKSELLKKHTWFYSTSANQSGETFDATFAKRSSDVVVSDIDGFSEKSASRLLKLSNTNIKRLR